MSVVEFGPPTPEAIQFIADNMRKEDAAEVWAYCRHTPIEALEFSVKHSKKIVIVYGDGVPLTALGLCMRDFLSGTGVPWLLSAEQALKYKRQFLKLSPPIIEEMLDICPKLVNYVHADNKLSIRWLKWLGFTIEDPEPTGPQGELFHRFTKEK
jgi:hypothetical protein